jgi:diguanylate cyclase (GGDEF)-like protein
MSKFTKRKWLLIGSLISVCGAQLWQRRKLRKVVSTIECYSRLSLAATRVAQNIRSLLDVKQILKVTIDELMPALRADQCVIRIEGDDTNPALVKSYSAEEDAALMSDFDACRTAIEDNALRYYVRQGHTLERDNNMMSKTNKPLLGARIAYGGRFLGTLMVRSNIPARTWSESEIQALLAVAHQVWEAVSQAQLFAEKEQQSLTDVMTGCLNRRAFDLQLENSLRLATEMSLPLSLVMVDVDHFKHINDTYGHAAGDQVLRSLAKLLREEIGAGATAARFGGEEFALILSQCSLEEAGALAERIRARVAGMIDPGINDAISASFGVAAFPLHGSSPALLIESADKALYQAKNTGRNRVCTA